jgi:hypothetical protein
VPPFAAAATRVRITTNSGRMARIEAPGAGRVCHQL